MKIIPLFANETSLIQKAKRGDQTAQFQLYKKYAPSMLAVCRRYVKDVQYAEDVSIQGFLKVFLRLHTFDKKGSFKGWVRRIMINESINYLKKKRRLVFDNNAKAFEKVSKPEIMLNNDAEYLLFLIDKLPETQRLVFILHTIDGYKHKEIAALLAIPESTSKTKVLEARKRLKQSIKQYKKRYESF